MGQFDATKGKQALEIRSSLSERRALTDPILPGDSIDLAHAHSRQWAKAHGEFETQTLYFYIFKYLFITCYRCTGKPHFVPNCTLSQMLTLVNVKHTALTHNIHSFMHGGFPGQPHC